MTEQAYTTQPLPGSQFGAEVFGFSLTQPLAPDVIEGIKRDVAKCAAWDMKSRRAMAHANNMLDAAHLEASATVCLTTDDIGWCAPGTRSWCSGIRESSAAKTRCAGLSL